MWLKPNCNMSYALHVPLFILEVNFNVHFDVAVSATTVRQTYKESCDYFDDCLPHGYNYVKNDETHIYSR